MGEFSLFHWLVVLALVTLLFGAGKLPKAMGDIGKALRAFREGLNEPSSKDDSKDK